MSLKCFVKVGSVNNLSDARYFSAMNVDLIGFKLDENNKVTRVGGVKYTIKDGVVYNSKKLLKEVKEMVDIAKKEAGYKIKQPGIN